MKPAESNVGGRPLLLGLVLLGAALLLAVFIKQVLDHDPPAGPPVTSGAGVAESQALTLEPVGRADLRPERVPTAEVSSPSAPSAETEPVLSSIQGHLFDNAGTPMPRATLWFSAAEGQGFRARTDDEGAYSATTPAGGLLKVWLDREPASSLSDVLLDGFHLDRGSALVRDFYVPDSALIGTIGLRTAPGLVGYQDPEDGSQRWYDYTLARASDGTTVARGQLQAVELDAVESRLAKRELLGVVGGEEAEHAEPGPEFFQDLRERLDAVHAAGDVDRVMDLDVSGLLPDYYTLNVQLAKLTFTDYTTGKESSTWIEAEFAIDFTRDGDPRRVWIIDAAQAEAEANERLHGN